jgi:hypothetical protein
MEEEGLPLRRRVPGAQRAGPGPWSPPRLSDSVLQRMQAAVDAAKAEPVDQAVEHDAAPQARIAVERPASSIPVSSVNGTSAGAGLAAVHGVQVEPERAAKPRRFSKRGDSPTVGKAERDRGARLKRMAHATGTAATESAGKARPPSESDPTELPMRTVPTPARQLQPPAPPEAAAPTSVTAPPKPSAERRPATLPKRTPSVRDTKPAAVPEPAERALPEASPRPATEPEPDAPPKRPLPALSKPAARPAAQAGGTTADLPRAQSGPTTPHSPAAYNRRTVESRPPNVSSARQGAAVAPPRQHPQPAGRGRRRRFGTARIVAACVVLAATASAAAFVLHGTPPATRSASLSRLLRQTAAYDRLAAAWITKQVTPGTSIACDKQMCSALAASGISTHDLDVLGPASREPFDATLIVETAAIRSLFGTSLNSQEAPAVLTTIGSGQAEITIRTIAPGGAAKYARALTAGQETRKQDEAALLGLRRISYSAMAKKTLADGNADMRLIVAITDVAASQPVDIVDFGSEATSPSADLPLRYADLAENDSAAHMSTSRYLAAIHAALSKVPAAYGPLWTSVVSLGHGTRVLRINVGAPSPLGFSDLEKSNS